MTIVLAIMLALSLYGNYRQAKKSGLVGKYEAVVMDEADALHEKLDEVLNRLPKL